MGKGKKRSGRHKNILIPKSGEMSYKEYMDNQKNIFRHNKEADKQRKLKGNINKK